MSQASAITTLMQVDAYEPVGAEPSAQNQSLREFSGISPRKMCREGVQLIMTRRRILLIASTALTALGGFWWWHGRLTEEERDFLGEWVNHNHYSNGTTCQRTWIISADRTIRYRNQYHFAATAERAACDETEVGQLFWSVREGRLIVVPEHPPLERLGVLHYMTSRKIHNLLHGQNEIVMDVYGSNGRLSHLEKDSFTVHWWDPTKKIEHESAIYRRKTDTSSD